MKKKAVIFVFGEGGHQAQMARLIKHLSPQIFNSELTLIGLVDNSSCSIEDLHKLVVLKPIRSKYSATKIIDIIVSICRSFIAFLTVLIKYNCRAMVSTGPGIDLLPAILMRCMGRKVVHIETWSRFNTRSLNGRFMYHLATDFYVQNKEQLKFYPKAKWSGRL